MRPQWVQRTRVPLPPLAASRLRGESDDLGELSRDEEDEAEDEHELVCWPFASSAEVVFMQEPWRLLSTSGRMYLGSGAPSPSSLADPGEAVERLTSELDIIGWRPDSVNSVAVWAALAAAAPWPPAVAGG